MKNIYIVSLLIFFSIFSCKTEEEGIPQPEEDNELEALALASYPLETSDDLDVLLMDMEDPRYVLLGEASHGTSEYYTWRAEISKRLIQEEGFNLVGVEGDWPALYRLNQYIKGSNAHGSSAEEVLEKLHRWPTWMWANEEVAEFAEWLREYNQQQPEGQQVGFYGIDVYSLWESMDEVVAYLEQTNPTAAQSAREAYACLNPYRPDEWAYAQAAAIGKVDCSEELAEILEMVIQQTSGNGGEAAFNTLQNALTVVNAERYYRTAVLDNTESWNIRDRHMVETIENLVEHQGNDSKIIVWEHNTHIGDARATDMAGAGMVNVGQLVREQFGDEGVYLLGFGSYTGTVIAAPSWGSRMQVMAVPVAKENSWEALLNSYGPADKIILLDELRENEFLMKRRGHRAIGVVYNPGAEQGNYVPSVLPERYDAFIFLEETSALAPLSPEINGARIGRESLGSAPTVPLRKNY